MTPLSYKRPTELCWDEWHNATQNRNSGIWTAPNLPTEKQNICAVLTFATLTFLWYISRPFLPANRLIDWFEFTRTVSVYVAVKRTKNLFINIPLGGLFVWIALSIAERGKDRGIDAWQCFVLVILPALVVAFFPWIFQLAGLPESAQPIILALYFIIPALLLRFAIELTWARSCAYGGIVFVSYITASVVVFYGFSALSPY